MKSAHQAKKNHAFALTITSGQETAIPWRALHLRPTRLGFFFLVLSAAVWLGAVNYQMNVVYAVCFWLLAFVGVSALQTVQQLWGIKIRVDVAGELFAGDHAQLVWHIMHSNHRRSYVFWWRAQQYYAEHEPETEHWHSVHINAKIPNYTDKWRLATKKRGHFPQPIALFLATNAPFGLFYVQCRLLWHTDTVIYPAPLSHSNFTTTAVYDHTQMPRTVASQGDDIAYLSVHQQGAPLQHVAWKVYAKRAELMDKLFDAPPPVPHKILISYRDYETLGMSRDKVASLLAFRVLEAHRLGLMYTLELPNGRIGPQTGQRNVCLNALALM